MSDCQRSVLGCNNDDRPAAPKAAFPSAGPWDVARVFVVPTEDGRYALSTAAGEVAVGPEQGPAQAVATVSGPGRCLTRVVREYSQRLFGLDAVRLLEQLARSGLAVAWPH